MILDESTILEANDISDVHLNALHVDHISLEGLAHHIKVACTARDCEHVAGREIPRNARIILIR